MSGRLIYFSSRPLGKYSRPVRDMLTSTIWSPGPGNPRLADDEVHIWRVWLGLCHLASLESHLAPEEQSRAGRFRFARDRDHFVACRGTLRHLLGSYLNRPPSAVEIDYGAQGKPILREGQLKSEIRFNVSHSHGL